MSRRALLPTLAAFVAAFFFPPKLAAQESLSGTLPNGLSYTVLALPQSKDASARLLVNAGSLDEQADEYGFAHFIEHLAFAQTRNFPAGTLVTTLQGMGLAIGADVNASTRFAHTSYQLELGEAHRGELDTALRVLRDFADAIEFSAEEVEQEKGVILSELRARDSVTRRLSEALWNSIYAGTAVATHAVVGTTESISEATPARLRAAYERLYRPDRMTVIVAGSFDARVMEQRIQSLFGTVGEGLTPASIPTVSLPPSQGTPVHVIPHSLGIQFSAADLVTSIRRGENSIDERRRELLQTLALGILDRRLGALREAMPSQYGAASARLIPGPTFEYDHAVIDVQASANRWANALELAEREVRRVRLHGFTQAELEEARTAHLALLRNKVDQIGARSARLATADVHESVLRRRTWRRPAEVATEAETMLNAVSVSDLQAAFNELVPEAGISTVILLPEKYDRPTPAKVAEVSARARRRTLRAVAEEESLVFKYGDFGNPGAIQERTRVPELDLDLIRLTNDVRVNLRPLATETARFQLSARIGRGTADVPKDRPGIARFSGTILQWSDLGRHSLTEIDRLLDLHGVTRTFAVVDDQATISMAGPSEELTFALQLLTAMLTDVRPVDSQWPSYLGRYHSSERAEMSAPLNVARSNALTLLANGDLRRNTPAAQYIAQYPRKEVLDWLRQKWQRGPVDVGIVGDIDPETLTEPLLATVGTLGKRGERELRENERLTLNSKAGQLRATFDGTAATGASFVQWPVALNGNGRLNAALALYSDILEDRLRQLLREKFGKIYAPSSGLYRHATQPDHAGLWIALVITPGEEQFMTSWSMVVANQLAKDGATEEEFKRALEPRRAQHARNQSDGRWWLNSVVVRAQRDTVSVPETIYASTAWDLITLADVNKVATAINGQPVLAIMVTPSPAPAGKAK